MIIRNSKVVILKKINYKVTKISINYKNKKFDFLAIFKSSYTCLLFLKDCNLMQGHVPWMPIFDAICFNSICHGSGKSISMGFQRISLYKQNEKQIHWHSVKKKKKRWTKYRRLFYVGGKCSMNFECDFKVLFKLAVETPTPFNAMQGNAFILTFI